MRSASVSLGPLLVQLRSLLAQPEANLVAIHELLEAHTGLAEFEVARFYASRHLVGTVEAQLRHPEPRHRMAAVRIMSLTFARAQAARLLRRMVKDPSAAVAAAARAGVRALGLRDVAPPDRTTPRRNPGPLEPGGWNPSGWFFGLFVRARKAPPRPPDLPRLTSRADVASFVGVERSALDALMRPGEVPGSPYVAFELPKRSGGVRAICAPKAQLKEVQRRILEGVLARIPPHPAAHGFVPGRSTVTNATPHVGAALVVKVDLEDFFPTIHFRRVRGLFEAYGYNAEVATTLAGLTTHRALAGDGTPVWPGVLPQGAPTSPAIANLVCRRMDARLVALARRFDGTYTRYADDLSFSFRAPPQRMGRFLWWLNAILQQEGFNEQDRKRRVMRRTARLAVTGLTVNERVSIPRDDRRRFKAILHNVKRHGLESQAGGREDFASWLEGYAAYVKMVHPELGARWLAEVRALTGPRP